MFADFCKCLFVKSYVRRLGLLLILFNDSTSYSFVILRLIIGINSKKRVCLLVYSSKTKFCLDVANTPNEFR